MTESTEKESNADPAGQNERVVMRQKLAESFILGFMVSRDGFNQECCFGHLAPTLLTVDYGDTEEEFRLSIMGTPEFVELLEKALIRMGYGA